VLQLTVNVPLPILDTWFRFKWEQSGAVSAGELRAAVNPVSELLRRSMVVSVRNRELALSELHVRFVPITPRSFEEPGPPAAHENAEESIGFFAGRLVADMFYPLPREYDEPALTWKLFNPVVLTAAANVFVDGGCRQHVFTTYAPTLVVR
jgi:hypothetical protein